MVNTSSRYCDPPTTNRTMPHRRARAALSTAAMYSVQRMPWAMPTAVCALVIHVVRLALLDRSLRRTHAADSNSGTDTP